MENDLEKLTRMPVFVDVVRSVGVTAKRFILWPRYIASSDHTCRKWFENDFLRSNLMRPSSRFNELSVLYYRYT